VDWTELIKKKNDQWQSTYTTQLNKLVRDKSESGFITPSPTFNQRFRFTKTLKEMKSLSLKMANDQSAIISKNIAVKYHSA